MRRRLRPLQTRGRRISNAAAKLARHRARALAVTAVLAIAAGGAMQLLGARVAGDRVWTAAVALLAASLAYDVGRTVVVDRHLGVDSIALVAMIGALALGEYLAGVVVGLMFSGGAALEDAASARARRELTALVERAPRVASVRVGGHIELVPIDVVRAGDVVVVRTGEVVPVDGSILTGEAMVDTSALTGEPLPVSVPVGEPVLSGTANAGG